VREVVTFAPAELLPAAADVLRCQGIPPGAEIDGRIETLVRLAIERFEELARPVAVLEDISPAAFADVYRGDGRNEDSTPVAEVYPRADRLVLFAGTVGENLSRAIRDSFDADDLAAAVMLDAAASEAAERLVEALEERLRHHSRRAVLAYSPGYCGWHVSGQRALFEQLAPEEVGISLTESCLMRPLKSVSGVLVAGHPDIHDFDDDYAFCAECATRECRARVERVRTLIGRI
jgi:hypothetical protein